MISEWDIEEFDYFIQTDDAIIAVYFEGGDIVEGWVISSRSGIENSRHVTIDKDSVVRELYDDQIDIIEEIPEWFRFERGVS